jgi:hypothetical protein
MLLTHSPDETFQVTSPIQIPLFIAMRVGSLLAVTHPFLPLIRTGDFEDEFDTCCSRLGRLSAFIIDSGSQEGRKVLETSKDAEGASESVGSDDVALSVSWEQFHRDNWSLCSTTLAGSATSQHKAKTLCMKP